MPSLGLGGRLLGLGGGHLHAGQRGPQRLLPKRLEGATVHLALRGGGAGRGQVCVGVERGCGQGHARGGEVHRTRHCAASNGTTQSWACCRRRQPRSATRSAHIHPMRRPPTYTRSHASTGTLCTNAPHTHTRRPHTTHHAGRGPDDLHAGVGRVILALALLAVVVAHVVKVLLVKLVAGGDLRVGGGGAWVEGRGVWVGVRRTRAGGGGSGRTM